MLFEGYLNRVVEIWLVEDDVVVVIFLGGPVSTNRREKGEAYIKHDEENHASI